MNLLFSIPNVILLRSFRIVCMILISRHSNNRRVYLSEISVYLAPFVQNVCVVVWKYSDWTKRITPKLLLNQWSMTKMSLNVCVLKIRYFKQCWYVFPLMYTTDRYLVMKLYVTKHYITAYIWFYIIFFHIKNTTPTMLYFCCCWFYTYIHEYMHLSSYTIQNSSISLNWYSHVLYFVNIHSIIRIDEL